MQAPIEELTLVPGMGRTKAVQLYSVFHQPLCPSTGKEGKEEKEEEEEEKSKDKEG